MCQIKEDTWNRIFFWICSILLIYGHYISLYPWFTQNYKYGEIETSTFLLMLLWFALYNFIQSKKKTELTDFQKKEKQIFTLPLIFLGMNILLEFSFFVYTDTDYPEIVVFALCFFLLMIISFFFICKHNQIKIWYPVSLFCTIYAIPGGEYSEGLAGAGFVVVFWVLAVIAGIIEYIIMLGLNLSKKRNNNRSEKTLFYLCSFLTACFLYVNTYGMYNEYNRYYLLIALFFIVFWFYRFYFFVGKMSEIQIPYQGYKKLFVWILPFLLLLLNVVIAMILYHGENEEHTKFCWWLNITIFMIAVLFYLSKRNQVFIWYPVSLSCSIYLVYGEMKTDILGEVEFVAAHWIALVFFSIIEYGIMLYLNRKKWCIPKDKRQKKE